MLPPLNHNKLTVTNNYILYYIVGANCVRPFLICYELTGDRRSPLRLCEIFNIVSTANRKAKSGYRKRAIAVERSETEGEKAINIKFSLSLPQSFFCEKRQLPRQREPMSDRARPCPQQITYKIKATDNRIFSLPCVKGGAERT